MNKALLLYVRLMLSLDIPVVLHHSEDENKGCHARTLRKGEYEKLVNEIHPKKRR